MTWPARRAGGSAASAAETVRRIVEQIRFGSIEPSPQPREFVRPKRFFRAVGGRAYTGEWWFEEEQLLHLSYGPRFKDHSYRYQCELSKMRRSVLRRSQGAPLFASN